MGERGEGGVEMEIWGGGCKLKCEGFWFRLAFYAASLMLPHLFIYGDADAVMSFRIVLDGAVFGTACCLLAWPWLSRAGKTCDARAPQQRAPDAVARALGSGTQAGTGGGRHVLLPGAAWSCGAC